MHWQGVLNVFGLAITTIAACLMFFFPPVVPACTDKGEWVISWVSATSDKDRKVAARRRRFSRFAVGLLMLGFLILLLAALLHSGEGDDAARGDAEAVSAPPAECASANSADECAGILRKAGRNPLQAYGVVGRQPVYRSRGPAAPDAAANGPTAALPVAAGRESLSEAPEESPPVVGVPAASHLVTHGVGNNPFERFGLDVVYGLVGTLREDTATTWKLFEYNISLNDNDVRATYGTDDAAGPIDAGELVRSTNLICRTATKQLQSTSEAWTVALRFIRWGDGELLAGPFAVGQANCR
jgi:hypothetical protein